MNLQRQSQRQYNIKSLQKQSRKECDVFNVIKETEGNKGVMLCQIGPGNVNTFNAEKAAIYVKTEMMNEEYIYLTEDLGKKEGLNEEKE